MGEYFGRWSVWWGAACIAGIFGLLLSSEACRDKIASNETCTGLQRFAYDTDWAVLVLAAIGIAGAMVLRRVQDQMNSRPCPRCGCRVPNGVLECEDCGFDFETLGESERTQRR